MALFKKASTLCLAAVLTVSSFLPLGTTASASTAQIFTPAASAADTVQYFLGGSSASVVSGSESVKGPLSNVFTFDGLDAGTLPDGTRLTLNKGVFINAQDMGADGDTDLQSILDTAGVNTNITNVSAYEFEFTAPPGKTSVALNFIFASQENYTSNYDIAGVFVDGVNYALLPNGSILRVTPQANLNNYSSPSVSGWRAWAPPQTLVGLLDPNLQTHRIKIAVANTGDSDVPSGLFLSGFTPGNATTGGVQPGGVAQDSEIAPVSGSFDKFMGNTDTGFYHDLGTALTLNGNTLAGITLDGASIEESNYTVADELVTLHKEYLSTLPLGNHEFTFQMDSGANPVLAVQVTDSTPPLLQSAILGDGQVSLSWSPVQGSTGYKVYQSVTSGTYGDEVAAVTGDVYSHTVAGLSNGTEYFYVVRAVNAGGDSTASNQLSAIPQISAPDAPVLQSAVSGNGTVSLTWSPVVNGASYKIYQSVTADTYGGLAATVSGDVYSYTVTGLTNGTKYYFVVRAENISGDSPASGAASSIPATTPASPTNISAVSGSGLAVVTFTPPTDNGGHPVIGYEVTASPGEIKTTGTGSPITVTGLTNGTAYTFTVKAINLVGGSGESVSSNEVTPLAYTPPAGGSSLPTGTTPATTGTDVLVNGTVVNAGTLTSSTVNGQSVLTLVLDQQKLEDMIATQGDKAVVTIPLNTQSDVVNVELNGQMIKNMENREVVLQIKTAGAIYSLPAKQINIDSMSRQLGQSVALGDITIKIGISTPTADVLSVVNTAASREGLTLLTSPLDFTVQGAYGDSNVLLTQFNGYVSRSIALPAGVAVSRITTGIVVDPDGTTRQVPTKVVTQDGTSFAVINSLTNSVYAVVYHPLSFTDVDQHWAKEAVNDFGSRMIINGTGNGIFNPDQDITRAEFASIVIKALGLKPENNTSSFTDVKSSDWYSGAVETANAYKLINGYGDGSFRPADKITREQAMSIIAKAMELTGLTVQLAGHAPETVLAPYADAGTVAAWAKDGIADGLQAGLITGRSSSQLLLAPKANMTRAEVAVILQRLLQRSDLI